MSSIAAQQHFQHIGNQYCRCVFLNSIQGGLFDVHKISLNIVASSQKFSVDVASFFERSV